MAAIALMTSVGLAAAGWLGGSPPVPGRITQVSGPEHLASLHSDDGQLLCVKVYAQRCRACLAVAAGVEEIFCLSTRTMQWFVERGFKEVPLSALPARRAAMYDQARNAKIYMKELASSRQIDAEELFWNMDFGDSARGAVGGSARGERRIGGGRGRGRGGGRFAP